MNDSVLVTGFEPFGGEPLNPSWLVAQALQGQVVGGAAGDAVVVAEQLPCVFGSARLALLAALQRHRPRLVLALGQAQGRSDFSIERVAINVDDARIADNAGAQPVDEPVVAGAPAGYFSTLPVKAMVAALREAGLPASVSQSAGTFVCNHVFFALMHALHTLPGTAGTRGGFMHLPLLPEQAARLPGQPCLPLATQVQGVRLAIAAALAHAQDLRVGGGAIS